MNGQDPKSRLRNRILTLRDAMPLEDRQAKSAAAAARLFEIADFVRAGLVAFFASFGSEIDTLPMIRRALAGGKRVALPRTDRARRRLVFHYVTDPDADLAPGTWGIPEPHTGLPVVNVRDLDLFVTPGVAFDAAGQRVGYGGGYYDRVFAEAGDGVPRLAVAFDIQVVDRVPSGDFDLPVHWIVTETRAIFTAERAEKAVT